MHTCEFCNRSYSPRPQVKRPRACKYCQSQRQSSNEKAWRDRHLGLYDKKYHQIKKRKRIATVEAVASKATECLKAGLLFMGIRADVPSIGAYITKLFLSIGIRKLNKLWAPNNLIV